VLSEEISCESGFKYANELRAAELKVLKTRFPVTRSLVLGVIRELESDE
jgi:hypothetical protein